MLCYSVLGEAWQQVSHIYDIIIIIIIQCLFQTHIACLHVQIWEPVRSSSAWILLSHTQKRFAESHTKPFLCVTQQNSGTRTKNWFPKVHM